jgi:thioredoxin-dependent peroxiredoxin
MSSLLTPGDPAPDFELDDVQGRRIRLSQFRGKPVILDFLRGFM